MSNKTLGRAMIGIVVVVALVTADRCYDRSVSRWEARVAAVQAQSDLRQARADSAIAIADSLTREAESRAAGATVSAAVTDTIIVHLPPAETPGEVERDEVIERLVAERDDFQKAFKDQLAATGELRAALAEVTADRDALAEVLDDRPGARAWWLPRVGIGVSTGLDTMGRPNTTAGLTIMWEISF